MMIINIENIKKLLDSEISSYQINKDLGISTNAINSIRRGERSIENLTLETGLKLSKYWEELNMTLEDKIKQYISEMDEEIRNGLYDVYLESNGNLWFVDSGMAYDGDDKSAKEVAQVEDGEIINLY